MKRLAFLAAVACLWGCALPGTGRAGMITYTETFTASGTLGTKPFTDEMVTLTGTGDTANVVFNSPNFFNTVTATVTVAGIGPSGSDETANVTDFTEIEDRSKTSDAGFRFQNGITGLQLSTRDSVFASYGLNTSIGPVSGPFVNVGSTNSIDTDEGNLTLTTFPATSTFEAAAPEPASLTLLGSGAAGLLGYGWRRKRTAA